MIVPVEMYVSIREVMLDAWRVLSRRAVVEKDHYIEGINVTPLINAELRRSFNNICPFQYLHHAFVRGLLRKASIECFIQTCENNPWERMSIMALRKYSPSTRILGYQHAVVPQASANMFAGAGETSVAPLPDMILTTGAEPRRIMERYGDYRESQLTESCGLRYEYLQDLPEQDRRRSGRTVLLALEGIPAVCRMVEYVLREIGSLDEYDIIVRTHPVLSFDEIRKLISRDVLSEAKYRISKGVDLRADVDAADAVIYWGTTVSMEALKAGKPVIHFDTGSVLSYDPLFECSSLKWKVSERDSLEGILREVFALNDDEYKNQAGNARSYLSEYFYPVTSGTLARFL